MDPYVTKIPADDPRPYWQRPATRHRPVLEVNESAMLTWECQLRREGTLPPAVQRSLMEYILQRPVAL
jgi:hypothetical protein